MTNVERQIELEKKITQTCIEKYRNELEKSKQQNNFSNTKSGSLIIANKLESFVNHIKKYINDYSAGKAVRSTISASLIQKLGAEIVGYIAFKVLLTNPYKTEAVQKYYRLIGQALEDEFKMHKFRQANNYYYDSIQKDLNSRGAKAIRKKYITQIMFKKRLAFHTDSWTIADKIQVGMILTNIFITTTGLMEYEEVHRGKKSIRFLVPSQELIKITDDLDHKLEVLEPFFLPMVAPPKPWMGIFDGGYLSPYIRKNKVIKNNNREYLNKLKDYSNEKVFEALNAIQNTGWQINSEVLNVVKLLWQEGQAVAGLPKRDDEPTAPYPFPNISEDYIFNANEKQIIAKWKRDTYEIHKQNVAQRSNRLLTSRIIRIAEQFKDEETIWFPYQMDFRGRMYPIPVLLQPQGSDLAKGLLRFSEGKPLETKEAIRWWKIHGANVFGVDKCSYDDRVKWVNNNYQMILDCANDPIKYREWTKADKPFQFLAWSKEFYEEYYTETTGKEFKTHIPIQLDGTCNGLQHYSALLRDEVAGRAVNLINTPIPSDIYGKVAEKLTEKLKGIEDGTINNNNNTLNDKFASLWLRIGINRKLTKRPVMVLPYGGTQLSCRQYIQAYLEENYSKEFLWKHFETGNNPNDCLFKVSNWLSHYLWEAIRETLKSAIIGMDYLKALTRVHLQYNQNIEWFTPMGLLIHQAYQNTKLYQITTELFGKIISTRYKSDKESINKQRQLNGICPNFIHSLDASCLMLWLLKCKEMGINQFMSVHDCYGVLAPDTELSAKLLREAFVEIYQRPILEDFKADLTDDLPEGIELPEEPKRGDLKIEEVIKSDYFFN